MANVVTTENLGAEFDLGGMTPDKVSVKNANPTQRGLVSTGDQTLAGVKRFAGAVMAGGTAAPHSKLQSAGSLAVGVALVTAPLTLTDTHHTVVVTAAVDVTVPSAVGCAGRQYVIKNISGAQITVLVAGGLMQMRRTNTFAINSFTLSTAVSPPNEARLISTGAEWVYSMSS